MTKILLLKNTLVNFAEEHRTNFILYVELGIFNRRESKITSLAFINSQFNYAPLIWMFANKSSIDEILKIRKRTLQIVYDVYDESFKNLLLNRSDDISIHQKHLRYFAIEVYKSLTMDQVKSWIHVEYLWEKPYSL